MKKVLSVALASAMVLGMGQRRYPVQHRFQRQRLIGRTTSNDLVLCL